MSMNKIQILPESVASKIAAGEVVQRPESVVKELLENSIDAESTHITLIIKEAGKNFIQVIDDGIGMLEEDAKIAFHRHSTSKIRNVEDLSRITTLGFRGEALYSIASVSRVELKTKTRDAELGVRIIVEGGKLIEEKSVNCEAGTNITVKNLFYNVPARRNFLKSNATEFKHIFDTFQRISLSYLDIRFTFIDDDKLIFDLPPSSLEKRLQYFFGESFIDTILPVQFQHEGITVSGFIGAPHFAKKNRGQQFLYFNNRFVINRSISHAIYRGYENLIEKGEYPFYLLFITICPQQIDVNVHPSKLEIKFEDENLVYSIVYKAIREALTQSDFSPKIELKDLDDIHTKTRFKKPFVEPNSFIAREIYGVNSNTKASVNLESNNSNSEDNIGLIYSDGVDIIQKTKKIIDIFSFESDDEKVESLRQVWQLHNKYILTPIKSGLMIIDQHVAHERILYEKAIERIENSISFSQQLLFPETLELNPADFQLVMELESYLSRLGFDFRQIGKNSIIIEGIPQDVKIGKEKEILIEILELYREFSTLSITNEKDNLAKSYACKSAIKAGDPLTEKEMISLIDNLFATKLPYVCPHGRPVFIKLTIDELDRRFGRTIKERE